MTPGENFRKPAAIIAVTGVNAIRKGIVNQIPPTEMVFWVELGLWGREGEGARFLLVASQLESREEKN